ncbi:glycosyltransferase family 39 protein, partial [Candidatus Sumerlaeota bacterium]|nr:glycosyltransferase family 39 protein [Candidatus Sumerlaeota bacterium]
MQNVASRGAAGATSQGSGEGQAVGPGASGRLWSFASLACLFLVLLGFALRLPKINAYAFNPDEAIALMTAGNATLGEVWTNTLPNTHPPANHFLLHFMLKISRSPAWVRLASLLAGTYLIWITIAFTRKLFGDAAGLTAGALVALSPNLIDLSRVCRNYGPGLALQLTALYFLVRFFRSWRWRDFFLYTAFELMASPWHYSFIVVPLAMKIILGGELIRRRARGKDWLIVIASALPLMALMTFLYFAHIRVISPGMVRWYDLVIPEQLTFAPGAFLSPLIQLSRYLLTGWLGKPLFYVAILSGAMLLKSGRRLEFFLCVTPVAVAYAFLMLGLIPLGGSRQSSYLFPFLFALVGVQAPLLLCGYRTKRWGSSLRRDRAAGQEGETIQNDISAVPRWRVAGVLLLLGVYAVNALASTFSDRPHTSQPELITRRADLDEFLSKLQERVAPGEIILLSYQAYMVLKLHLDPGPSSFAPGRSAGLDHGLLRMRYTPHGGWTLAPEAFRRPVAKLD